MEVIGQFNNSFIIAQLEDDLFILDQHACDEKGNYESLRRAVCLHTQRLITYPACLSCLCSSPLPLELSPDQEFVVLQNRPLFQQNGFEITVDETKTLGSRILLTALPSSKQYTFSTQGARRRNC